MGRPGCAGRVESASTLYGPRVNSSSVLRPEQQPDERLDLEGARGTVGVDVCQPALASAHAGLRSAAPVGQQDT